MSSQNEGIVLKSIEKSKILVFDVETTGIPSCLSESKSLEHEILQLAMVDADQKILFEGKFKPRNVLEWTEAETVHGITPYDVRDKPSIENHANEIQRLIDKSDLLVAYNFQYDYVFLRSIGISFLGKHYCDVMRLFAQKYLTRRHDGSLRLVSLKKCSEYFGYKQYSEHDALEDVFATLHCFLKLREGTDELS